MAVDSMRISQILPTVKCSKCSATISLNDMSNHICSRPGGNMGTIAESPTSTLYEHGQRPRERLTERTQDRGIFNSANKLYRNPDATNPASPHERLQITSDRDEAIKYPAADARAVLGKIHSLKTGVLGSNGLQRPIQQSRSGPIQTYDPRATMVPIRVDQSHRGRQGTGRPIPPRLNDLSHSKQADDVRSITSSRSNKSFNSTTKSFDSTRQQQDELFASSLSPTDSGPFHHVSSKLDPTIFVPSDVTYSSNGKSQRNAKPRNQHRHSASEDWDEQGYDDNADTFSMTSHKFASTTGPRPSRSAGSNLSNSSFNHNVPTQYGHQLRHQEMLDSNRPRTAESAYSSRSALRSGQTLRDMPEDYSKPLQCDDGASHKVHRYADSAIKYPHSQTQQNFPTISIEPSRKPQSKTHVRNETSSSLGTVLTNASMFSARSSVSSPPSSEINYNLQNRDIRYRAQAHTPTPCEHANEATPTIKSYQQSKAATQQADSVLPRSETTGSFDRLLQDIGSSIDQLEVPKTKFADVQGSPSSNYSPIVPAEPFASPPHSMAAPKVLGSPASLQSKDTTSSKGSRNVNPHKNRVKETKCMACAQVITGKSIASADGKLSGRYHKTCFRCTDPSCHQVGFPDGQFYVYDDRPYCSRHYHAQAGSLCAKCGEGIEGECLATVNDERYHVHCHAAQQHDGRNYRHF